MKITPSFAEFEQLAKHHTVVPVYTEIASDLWTPVTAMAALRGEGPSYLLESVSTAQNWGRYSFVGAFPEFCLRAMQSTLERVTSTGVERIQTDNPWEALRTELARHKTAPVFGVPRFAGGAVGYVGYDAVHRFEPTVKPKAPSGTYEYSFAFGGALLAFDNQKQTLKAISLAMLSDGQPTKEAYACATQRLERMLDKLTHPPTLGTLALAQQDTPLPLFRSNQTREQYENAVRQAQTFIRAGDIFQVVLSQQFQLPAEQVDPINIYRAMRVINPSPYMYYLDFPEAAIAGASPETLVRVEDQEIEVRPIAGTRPRGSTPNADQALERELLADGKEVAEHVMLVDLARNDVGRVSQPGSVRIDEKMSVERYSHVMHMTSSVKGLLGDEHDSIDVIRATLPAGTLSGAPKVRALQIIDALEPTPRGVYGGAVGYIGFDGNMDLAIAIRTVVKQGDTLWVQAGAGIVEQSVAANEYDESMNKAKAAMTAIAAARALT